MELTPLFSELSSVDDFHVLIESFANSLPAKARTIREAIKKDPISAAPLLHKFQGAAGGYGYPSLSRLAAAIEKKIHAGIPAVEFQNDLNELETLISRVKLGLG